MTMENDSIAGQSSLIRRLPWLVGLAGLILYFVTLHPWVSVTSMGQVAKVAGYSWQTETLDPLYYVVSAPLRFLPPRLVPAGVNFLSAFCAALALACLARAVSLLPHDRTHDQREREASAGAVLSGKLAWLPPALAVLACGLQLTFWEHATNGTPEMLHLLFFAYAVRVLLEYRYDGREVWLYKGIFAMAAVMTSDWLMVAFGLVYLVAMVWVCGLDFFRARFLGRLVVCGLAGLSLYLLLPLLASFSDIEPLGFWESLRMNLSTQRYVLGLLPKIFPKNVMLLLSLTSVLPILIMSFKWASHFGDSSQVGQLVTRMVFHFFHLLLLLVCLWVSLDPRFSPRTIGYGLPLLSLYFLAALSVGYFSGYLLVVFRPVNIRGRRPVPFQRPLQLFATGLVVLLAVATTALLFLKNHHEIRIINRNDLRGIAEMAASKLPKSGYLISDDPKWALLARIWLDRVGRSKDFVIAESWALRSSAYHRYQIKVHGQRWPFAEESKRTALLGTDFMMDSLKRLEKLGDLYYLHPSFGFFFERYYIEPHGMLYKLIPYREELLLPPALSSAVVGENEAFWSKVQTDELTKLLGVLSPKDPAATKSLREQVSQLLKLSEESHGGVASIGGLYSRAINYWGVELQKLGELDKAEPFFELAQKLNPKNIVAKINLAYNRGYRSGKRERVGIPNTVEDLFGEFSSFDAAMTANGPFDEQNICYALGLTLYNNGLYRQSAQAFTRVNYFAPNDPPTRLWLGQISLLARQPNRTIELARELMHPPAGWDVSGTYQVDALSLTARAHLQLREEAKAKALIEEAILHSPTNTYLLVNAVSAFAGAGDNTNALVYTDRLLQLQPTNDFALLHKGYLSIQTGEFDSAVRAMTGLLALQTNRPEALLNRAIAYYRSDKLDEAKRDYEALQRISPGSYQVYYGLGEIALRRKDTNTAILQFQSYLSNAIPNSAEAKLIGERLRELQGSKPAKP